MNEEKSNTIEESNVIGMQTDLVIGDMDQPDAYQLGEPNSVRTDAEGNIYITDAASMKVKVFDSQGTYLRSFGGRGRGPGEFLELNLMGMTPEGEFVFWDRFNLRYTVLDKNGEQLDSFPIDLSNQYYPQSIDFFDEGVIALYLRSSVPSASPIFKRKMFHVLSKNIKNIEKSFFPFNRLGYEKMAEWIQMDRYPGSFTLSLNNQELIYSPGIYNKIIYTFQISENGKWEFTGTIRGISPGVKPIQVFTSETTYREAKETGEPGLQLTYFGEGPHMRKVNSMDAGIYCLRDGRIIQFFTRWRQDEKRSSGHHTLELWAQLFTRDGNLQTHGYIFSIRRSTNPDLTMVNWKDGRDRFYLLNTGGASVPTVRRFSLELPEDI